MAIDGLVAEGVQHVFGLPGTTIMDLIDAIGQRDDITYWSVRHEQSAAHMADGYFRASGRLAVGLASRGPGAANMAIGVHNAYAESIPLLALIGQVPDAIAHRESFEELDVVAFFQPITKWAVEVHTAKRVPEFMQRAIRTAQAGRARPVAVSLPLDVQQERVEHAVAEPGFRTVHPAPRHEDLVPVLDLLARAERPVIVLGGGMLRPAWSREAVALAEAAHAPVATAWMRKNAFPNQHPLYVGTLGFGAHRCAEKAVSDADVLLALGCRFSEFTTRGYRLVSDETKIIQVDIDSNEVGAIYRPEIGVAADAWGTAAALAEMLEQARGLEGAQREARAQELRAAYLRESELPPSPGDRAGVPSAAVVATLAGIVDRHQAIVVQDAHSFGPWVGRYMPFTRPGTYYAAAGGSMGWGLPAALGIQAARPLERVIAVCGDGSFWMVAQELETAVRQDLPIVVVVTNNFSFGNTRDRQRHSHGGRYVGVFYANPDFAAFARLLGAHGERVESEQDLGPALTRALESGRPAVVDVIQDKHEGLPGDLKPLSTR